MKRSFRLALPIIATATAMVMLAPQAPAAPVSVDGLWQEFEFTGAGSPAVGCGLLCVPSSSGNSAFAPAPPWTFDGGPTLVKLTVTDAFDLGDRFEVFDSGDLQMALAFVERGVLSGRLLWQIVLGVRYGAMSDPQTMMYFVSRLPRDAQWTAFGIGRMAFPMLAQSFLLGGHVRIGMEDTVYLDKGVLTPSNAALVE